MKAEHQKRAETIGEWRDTPPTQMLNCVSALLGASGEDKGVYSSLADLRAFRSRVVHTITAISDTETLETSRVVLADDEWELIGEYSVSFCRGSFGESFDARISDPSIQLAALASGPVYVQSDGITRFVEIDEAFEHLDPKAKAQAIRQACLAELRKLLRVVEHAIQLIVRAVARQQFSLTFVVVQRSWHLRHGAHPPHASDRFTGPINLLGVSPA